MAVLPFIRRGERPPFDEGHSADRAAWPNRSVAAQRVRDPRRSRSRSRQCWGSLAHPVHRWARIVLLRCVGLSLLVLISLGLIFPPVGRLTKKPFARIPQRPVNGGSAFFLGLGLGLLYVPCAGPVPAAISVAGARGEINTGIVALTLSFAAGAAVPLLAFALSGRRVAERVSAFRTRARKLRVMAGSLIVVLAFALAFDVITAL
ncbi:cytochrome c biogenesis protein CcdA [Streptomyces roseus]|uniref:cytochrome c biogenesis protein CcdA n=1 Tax=Streptomyces roseus TaxID=66430 RepID=UPI00069D727D|nr:cytochrome c biogenesis protein CcdA [Streptomyces roseus]